MKRVIGFIAFICFFMVSALVFAEESSLFVKTMPITKVYSHKLGYKVVYPKGDLLTGELYLPAEWFEKAGSKGEIVWGTHPSYPYISIFYENGKFSHVRLYLEKNINSASWDRLPEAEDHTKDFSIETISLK